MIAVGEELRAYSEREGIKAGASGVLHEQDFLLQFLLGNSAFKTHEEAIDHYLREGKRSAVMLSGILFGELGLNREAGGTILEFAAGYGRVTRHIEGCVAPWKVTASDIHAEANAFNAKHLGVATLQSSVRPEDFPRDRQFTVVFALSFLSHMPPTTWSKWLRCLWECVEPGGCLIFTTQGMASRLHFGSPEMPESGIWFTGASEQGDLSTEDYGQTIVTIPFVLDQVRSILPGAYPRLIRPAFWFTHQDLFVIGHLPPGN